MVTARPITARVDVNMADVAARAGVSIATVSRALRGLPGVRHDTRERVRAIAEELAYVVSPEASRLARRDTGRVAVVVPRVDSWFFSTVLGTLEASMRRADLDLLLYQVESTAERERFFRELPARRKVDALVLVALPLLPEEEQRLDLLGRVVVLVGGRLRDYPHVTVDDHAVAACAVHHLAARGHSRIAMVRTRQTDRSPYSSDRLRAEGWRDALLELDLPAPASALITRPPGVRAGYHATLELLDSSHPPTAVLASSDEMAVSVLAAVRSRGLRVPDDVAVIGVDGHPVTEVLDLSTVDQGVVWQAEHGAQMVLRLLQGEGLADSDVRAPFRLLARGSTAAPLPPLISVAGGDQPARHAPDR